jgi:hypothetical protein
VKRREEGEEERREEKRRKEKRRLHCLRRFSNPAFSSL